jgi:hypothetical protein
VKTIGKFILNGTQLVPVYDLFEWANALEKTSRVAYDQFEDVAVSTVFFGFDMNYGIGRQALFETMVFGSGTPYAYGRYATYDEAVKGHADALKLELSKWGKNEQD